MKRKNLSRISSVKRKKIARIFKNFALLQIIAIILLCLVFLTKKTANDDNTYNLDVQIVDIAIDTVPNGVDIVYFKTQDSKYMTYWKKYDTNYQSKDFQNFKYDILNESVITITVLKNSESIHPLWHGYETVVDIRSDACIYYDICDYNRWQKNERIAGVCAVIIYEIVIDVIYGIIFYTNQEDIKRSIKNRTGPIRGRDKNKTHKTGDGSKPLKK